MGSIGTGPALGDYGTRMARRHPIADNAISIIGTGSPVPLAKPTHRQATSPRTPPTLKTLPLPTQTRGRGRGPSPQPDLARLQPHPPRVLAPIYPPNIPAYIFLSSPSAMLPSVPNRKQSPSTQ